MMIMKRKWLMLGPASLLIAIAGALQTTDAYEYVESIDPYYVWDDDIYNQTSTKLEDAYGDAQATETGTLSCYASAYTWATEDDYGRIDYLSSHAVWTKSWEWNGPSGTAPGGSLSWYDDGDGSVIANGKNTVGGGGYAWSLGYTQSSTSAWSPSSTIWAAGDANAYVVDLGYPTGGSRVRGEPEKPNAYPNNDTDDPGEYYYSMTWDSYDEDDNEQIASGTGQFSFWGSVFCSLGAASGAGPTESSNAWADMTAYAGAKLRAVFTPDP